MRTTTVFPIILALLTAAIPTEAASQASLTDPPVRFAAPSPPMFAAAPEFRTESRGSMAAPDRRSASPAELAAAGLIGGALGFAGGAALGYALETSAFPCACDDPGLFGIVVGALVGSAAVAPYAVHRSNDREGLLLPSYAAASAIAGAGILVMTGFSFNDAAGGVMVGLPIAQMLSAVVIEQTTARTLRDRARPDPLDAPAVPR